jgi:hypothetical protein
MYGNDYGFTRKKKSAMGMGSIAQKSQPLLGAGFGCLINRGTGLLHQIQQTQMIWLCAGATPVIQGVEIYRVLHPISLNPMYWG